MRVSVIGSTGSVGAQALDVAKRLGIQALALAARSSVAILCGQVAEHAPEAVSVGTAEDAARLEASLDGALGTGWRGRVEVLHGDAGIEAAAAVAGAEMAVVAVSGIAGLRPALAAARAGKRLALANKECIVAAGALVKDALDEGASLRRDHEKPALIPLDSEHSAIFQCLQPSIGCLQPSIGGHAAAGAAGGGGKDANGGGGMDANGGGGKDANGGGGAHRAAICVDASACGVARVILTASGGPFRTFSQSQLASVTPSQALEHPVWRMGAKITVDCATLANKGLEVIEASLLFGLPPERIDVVVHPQGAVHSLVEFRDGAMLAQLGSPDMRTPIQYAFTWPGRVEGPAPPLSLAEVGAMTFERPDESRFPCLALAYAALGEGGAMPAVFSAADEAAVGLFCEGALRFTDIPRVIGRAMEKMGARAEPRGGIDDRLAETLAIDSEARARAAEAACSLPPVARA